MADDILEEISTTINSTVFEKNEIIKTNKDKKHDEVLIDPPKKKNWFSKNWKFLAGFVVTFGMMIYLIMRSEPKNMLVSLRNSNYWLILASFGGTILIFLVKIFRWKAILKQQGHKIKFLQTLKLVLIGTFGSAITPAKVGDILRAFYLSKEEEEIKVGTSVFSVVFDRILDLTGIFLIVGFFSPFILSSLGVIDWKIPVGIGVGFLVFILLIIFVFSEKVTKPILNFILRYITKVFRKKESQEKINLTTTEIIDDFYSGQKNYNLKHYLWLGFLSVLFWILLGFQGCLILFAVGYSSFEPFIIITTLCMAAVVALTIPTSISGIGIRDSVILYVLGILIGTSDAQALSLSIIQTFLNVLLPGLIGGILLFMYNKRRELKPKKGQMIPN
ncbi:MAG: flippase-like domain-containing protein [Asgard group archaeon]|nr:flippase-like domain-containing protein [Asgard group archaeon]